MRPCLPLQSTSTLPPFTIQEVGYLSSDSMTEAIYTSPKCDTSHTSSSNELNHPEFTTGTHVSRGTFPVHTRSRSLDGALRNLKHLDDAVLFRFSLDPSPELSSFYFNSHTSTTNSLKTRQRRRTLSLNDRVSPIHIDWEEVKSLCGKTPFCTGDERSSLNFDGSLHSSRFPHGYILNRHFVCSYELQAEIGTGGYGFVMTAHDRKQGHEVAVKFIIKSKVPEQAWVEDKAMGRLPAEIMILCLVDHENIVKCLDVYEDELYFYLVQELHGWPWTRTQHPSSQGIMKSRRAAPSSISTVSSLPALTPSTSEDSIDDFELDSPPHNSAHSMIHISAQSLHELYRSEFTQKSHCLHAPHAVLPKFNHRPSHDLFECIEQSPTKRLPEAQARYVFAQVVEAVYYLDGLGITHRDIKDENLVIDRAYKVKLIDFGSAILSDPNQLPPYFKQFFGTAAYASSEILCKKPYQAAPAEIWTLGVLLSYLLTGTSPFLTEEDAIAGKINLVNQAELSKSSRSVMHRCLEVNPKKRADVREVRAHPWLRGALCTPLE